MTQDFQEIFDGQTRGHGYFRVDDWTPHPVTGKINGEALTIRGPATPALWEEHFAGNRMLGILPVRDDSKCRWGALDIDVYKDLDPLPILQKIRELKLPLVPCRSKSGGLHFYLFLNEFAPAQLVKDRLLEWAGILGHGGCEVWPKQTTICADKQDLGNWINMPYFGDQRKALDCGGEPLDIHQFVQLARASMISIQQLKDFTIRVEEKIEGGPPCLQTILGMGVQSGNRNKVAFALAIYCQKAFGEEWEQKLEELNQKFFSPPLPANEIATIVKSVKKKAYFYTCNQAPLLTYCNKSACRKCKFGIGNGDHGLPVLGTLTKVCHEEPIYFLDVEGGGRLELSAEQIQSQTKFQLACLKQLNTMPPQIPAADWRNTVTGLLKKLVEIDIPIQTTNQGILREHLERFLTNTAPAEKATDLLLGRPILEDGLYMFRHIDFVTNLQRHRFQGLEQNKIVDLIRRWGATSKIIQAGGSRIQVWSIALAQNSPAEIPAEFTKQETPY